MKLRVFIMDFEKPLTEAQENILISYFKGLPEDISKGIMDWHRKSNRAGNLLGKIPLVGHRMKDQGDMLGSLAEYYSMEMKRLMTLSNPLPNRYEFKYPQKLKHFVLISNDGTLVKLFNEAKEKMGNPEVKTSFEEREAE